MGVHWDSKTVSIWGAIWPTDWCGITYIDCTAQQAFPCNLQSHTHHLPVRLHRCKEGHHGWQSLSCVCWWILCPAPRAHLSQPRPPICKSKQFATMFTWYGVCLRAWSLSYWALLRYRPAVPQRLISLIFWQHCFAFILMCQSIIAASNNQMSVGKPASKKESSLLHTDSCHTQKALMSLTIA